MKHDHPIFLFVAGLTLCLLVYLWATLLMATEGPVLPCSGVEGTDAYYECQTGAPIDLSPIQDEADTPLSTERNGHE